MGLRVNTLKLSPDQLAALVDWNLAPVPWCDSGFTVGDEVRPGKHPFHAAGLYYLQEPSAMSVAQALNARPGERVLDLAAAPGGKSTHLAAQLQCEGLLVANDVSGERARELSRNLERWGARNCIITSETPARLAQQWGASFDAVLLDAPCSGEGMFRKSEEAVRQWTPQLVASCAARQDGLLDEAARLVKPGGRLAYSTCTLNPAENEQVIERFLHAHPGWRLASVQLAGAASGIPEWSAHGTQELSGAARFWPHRVEGEGHFVALLLRDTDAPSGRPAAPADGVGSGGRKRKGKRSRQEGGNGGDGEARAVWQEFAAQTLEANALAGDPEVRLYKEDVYALSPAAPDLSGLRVLRPGLWLGTLRRGRFMPSHALALALDPAAVRLRLELGPRTDGLGAYLAGLELDAPGPDGYVLVTVGGFPLGWGRRKHGTMRNLYPKGLRTS